EVPADKVADFAIDFDACKSFVRAGNSGKILLKPVLAVIPMLSDAGQRIEGWLDASLAGPGTKVTAQLAGRPVRGTPPAADGKFVLYPVPAGTYDLVITADGRVNAAMTGVPVTNAAFTTIGSATARIDTPVSVAPPAGGASAPAGPASAAVSGTITLNTSTTDIGGEVRATQSFTGGPTLEAGSANAASTTGAYSITLPTGAPAKVAYAAGATTFTFTADTPRAGLYKLEATATGFATAKTADITLTAPLTQNFTFP
ncbi:MAG: hypothetical protein JNL30_02420, partial [Rubrivivax sp.]|nr:hypothetical protein [Rubrivivax sp.]